MKPYEWLGQLDEDTLTMPEYEDALVGMCLQFGRPGVALYDYTKVIANLMSTGMSYEDAVEFFDFNIIGAWVGEYTPAFVVFYKDDSVTENDAEPV